MESRNFLAYINKPDLVDSQSLKQFEELQKEYPYCQTAQLLYALNLFAENHPHYPVQLKRASAYASDRRHFKHLIDRYRIAHQASAEPEKPFLSPKPLSPALRRTTPIPPPPPLPRHFTTSPSPPPSLSSPPSQSTSPHHPRIGFKPVPAGSVEIPPEDSLREKLLEIVHQRLKEIAEEHGKHPDQDILKHSTQPPVDAPDKRRVTFSVEQPGSMSKEELIEKFIQEEPRISSPRTVFLKPTQATVRDLMEEEEIVSETLAILYHKQGYTAKSIRIYEKLCLLFPEKNSYFAARIEDLKNIGGPDDKDLRP